MAVGDFWCKPGFWGRRGLKCSLAALPQVFFLFCSLPSHGTSWSAGPFCTGPIPLPGKRFKKWAGFLPNAHQKKFGEKIAGYFYRFAVFPLTARSVPEMRKIKTKNTGRYPWNSNLGWTGELKTMFYPPKCHLGWIWSKISQSLTHGFPGEPKFTIKSNFIPRKLPVGRGGRQIKEKEVATDVVTSWFWSSWTRTWTWDPLINSQML